MASLRHYANKMSRPVLKAPVHRLVKPVTGQLEPLAKDSDNVLKGPETSAKARVKHSLKEVFKAVWKHSRVVSTLKPGNLKRPSS